MKSKVLIFLICFSFLRVAAFCGGITRVIRPERHATAYAVLDMLPLSQFKSIADLGCGGGEITAYIAHNTAAVVVGLDISQECIETAQASFALPNLFYAVMNIDQWQLPPEQFNLITAFHTLHWVEDFQKALNNCAKSLTPKGILAVTTAHTDHFLYKSIIETAQLDSWKDYFIGLDLKPWHCSDQNSFVSALKQAGLEPVCIEVWHKEIVSESREEFIAWVQSWLEPIAHFQILPNNYHQQFLESIIDHFLKTIPIQDDGSFSFMTPILVFYAQKQ